ncbi:MAG: hydroxymethylbilane synthase [Sphingobacteriales bacterium]|nr:MAG: hydroxymethylbilane synthase [Sphingobacteriales bacterium]
MQKSTVIIGTRGSKLALWQANYTQNLLAQNNITSEIKIIQTKGDASQTWNTSFDKLEGKGFFTKELEEALLAQEIDLAVHSCKDLPTQFPLGLTIAAYSKRANPFDVLLINKQKVDISKTLSLQNNAIVGTSSSRRKAQLLAYRNDIEIKDIRGNVPTRIEKLRKGEFDAIVLAQAGIDRLEICTDDFFVFPLVSPMFVPAINKVFWLIKLEKTMKICNKFAHY